MHTSTAVTRGRLDKHSKETSDHAACHSGNQPIMMTSSSVVPKAIRVDRTLKLDLGLADMTLTLTEHISSPLPLGAAISHGAI